MAALFEQYVQTVHTLSSSGKFTQLSEYVSQNTDALLKYSSHLDSIFSSLDYQQGSLGILGILCVKYNSSHIPDMEMTLIQTTEFLSKCNGEQVKYAADMYAQLCQRFTRALIDRKMDFMSPVFIFYCRMYSLVVVDFLKEAKETGKYARGINPLMQAIRKIQKHEAQLTSIHASLCQLCLLSKNLKPAIRFLDIDITEISRESGHFDSRDLLLFYYYGGMIYTALKNYERALYFFEVAISTPSVAVSHIMMESYKKFILVSLILHGKIISLPSYAPQVLQRYIKPLCQPYVDFASAYAHNNLDDVRVMVTKHTETYNKDNNMGLVKQSITSLIKKNIQRLTKTFLTLSLDDMANRVQLSGRNEAEKYVLHMIEEGEIYATINQKDGMVQFHDNPKKYNDPKMLLDLDKEMERCIQLDAKLAEMDREISLNAQYIQKHAGSNDDDLPGSSIVVGKS